MRRRLSAIPAAAALFLTASSAFAVYSPATTAGWFITAGRVQGQFGALFRTDLWLFNPDSSTSATLTLTFHPAVGDGAPAAAPISSAPITLAPRETKFFPDVSLSTVPAGDGVVGALQWQSSSPILGAGRIYTAAPAGTFGFFLPALPITESLTEKTAASDTVNVLQIFGVNSGDANFRTNLDVTNTSAVALPIEVRVIDPVTTEIYGGTLNYTVAPGSLLRLGAVLTTAGAPQIPGLRITVAVRETAPSFASGGVIAAAYTLDNRTQDAFAFVGQRQ
ncbi:MAG TPA: hypothetical protein VGS98_08680 [Thermoanaerobaculia bacterium]|jgi:hypothetical protein|nr:hypothetical protein [Thermoanaerobaculia bacterium]